MNLPNKLTVFRVILIPFFVCFMLADIFGGIDKYIAVGIFIVASLTDLLDGKIARTKKNRTEVEKRFGIQIDSLSDIVCFGVAPAALVTVSECAV